MLLKNMSTLFSKIRKSHKIHSSLLYARNKREKSIINAVNRSFLNTKVQCLQSHRPAIERKFSQLQRSK